MIVSKKFSYNVGIVVCMCNPGSWEVGWRGRSSWYCWLSWVYPSADPERPSSLVHSLTCPVLLRPLIPPEMPAHLLKVDSVLEVWNRILILVTVGYQLSCLLWSVFSEPYWSEMSCKLRVFLNSVIVWGKIYGFLFSLLCQAHFIRLSATLPKLLF